MLPPMRASRVIATALLMAVAAAGAVSRDRRSPRQAPGLIGYLYLNEGTTDRDDAAAGNAVSGFAAFADGSLAPLPGSPWSTTGVDPNIISATVSAIIEGYEYGLLLRRGALRPAGAHAAEGAESQAAAGGACANVTVQPRGEGRLPIVILNEIDPGRSEIGA